MTLQPTRISPATKDEWEKIGYFCGLSDLNSHSLGSVSLALMTHIKLLILNGPMPELHPLIDDNLWIIWNLTQVDHPRNNNRHHIQIGHLFFQANTDNIASSLGEQYVTHISTLIISALFSFNGNDHITVYPSFSEQYASTFIKESAIKSLSRPDGIYFAILTTPISHASTPVLLLYLSTLPSLPLLYLRFLQLIPSSAIQGVGFHNNTAVPTQGSTYSDTWTHGLTPVIFVDPPTALALCQYADIVVQLLSDLSDPPKSPAIKSLAPQSRLPHSRSPDNIIHLELSPSISPITSSELTQKWSAPSDRKSVV